MHQPENIIDIVFAINPVLILSVDVWFMFILKKTFAPIPEPFVEPKNGKTLHADLILAGITQLITVVLADKIKHHEYIRSLKPLIA